MQNLRQLRIQRATIGVSGMASLALRNRLGRRLRTYDVCRPLAEEARGLEIGGPSAIFAQHGALPLYPHLATLDNCDFADETIWHGRATDGTPFFYDPGRAPGVKFVRDATALDGLLDGSYDLLLSSHTLEHLANPLLALYEWKRVLRPGGHLVLVLPHIENTFDHRRPVTTLQHLEADFAASTPEDDEAHFQEFIELCDLTRVPERLSRRELEKRTRNQAENRALHHHVFDTDLVVSLLHRAGYELVIVETALPFHIVALGSIGVTPPDNDPFLSRTAEWRQRSVFRRDRQVGSTLGG